MIRVLFLVVCLVCTAMGRAEDSRPVPKRRPHAFNYVYPNCEISVGAQHAMSDYKTKSYSHWYHDADLDKMIYDENLYYDIYSFEGFGPLFDTKIGVLLFRRVQVFLDFGFVWSVGNSLYKYYSRDEEEFREKGRSVRLFWGLGNKVYPFVDVSPILDGIFVGAALSFMDVDNSWKKYEMSYMDYEVGGRFEVGNLWKLSEHFFLGITLNAAIYGSAVGSKNTEDEGVFRVGESPNRDPVDGINSLQFGAALSVVHR